MSSNVIAIKNCNVYINWDMNRLIISAKEDNNLFLDHFKVDLAIILSTGMVELYLKDGKPYKTRVMFGYTLDILEFHENIASDSDITMIKDKLRDL